MSSVTDPTVGRGTEADRVRRALERLGPRLFGADHGEVRVELRSRVRRAHTGLYRYRLTHEGEHRGVIAKVRAEGAEGDPARSDRSVAPRLLRPVPADAVLLSEYRALQALEARFGDDDDPRFGVIRTLGILEDRVVLMEEATDPLLSRLAVRGAMLPRRSIRRRVEAGVENLGAWLDRFHRMAPPDGTTLSILRHEDVMAHVRACFDALRSAGSGTLPDIEGYERAMVRAGERVARDQSVPVILHGDCAMRNVLVSEDGRVSVLDTRASHRGPGLLDVGHFMATLRAGLLPSVARMTGSRRWLTTLEDTLLRGYVGSPGAGTGGRRTGAGAWRSEVEWYCAVALVDRWAVTATRRAGARRGWTRLRLGFLARQLEAALMRSVDNLS